MGKKILRTLLFFGIFAVLFAGLNHLMAPKDTTDKAGMHEAHAKAFLAEPENTVDVVILGNSEAYRGVAPLTIWEEYGITAYSCGTNDQILYQTEDYLARFFETQSPKVVLLETDVIYRNFSTMDEVPHMAEELFPLIRYHDRWKNLNLTDFTQPIRFAAVSEGKGYDYIGYAEAIGTEGYMEYSEDVSPFPGKNYSRVVNLLDMCRENGAELILFSTPSVMNWSYPRHNAMVQLAQELGLEYIDMNLLQEEIPIDWQVDTMDLGNHMNYTGARKVSSYLGKYLSERNLFEDKRMDPAFAQWNDAVDAYYSKHKIDPTS
jgi:hypothetical protein